MTEPAIAHTASLYRILNAVQEWRDARAAFLALAANHPEARQHLARLASAEDTLFQASKDMP